MVAERQVAGQVSTTTSALILNGHQNVSERREETAATTKCNVMGAQERNVAELDCTKGDGSNGDGVQFDQHGRPVYGEDGEDSWRDLDQEDNVNEEDGEDGDDTIPHAQLTDTEITNMKTEVLDRRRLQAKVMYYLLDPIVTCSAIGVEMKYMGDIHYWKRDAYISAKTPIEDTTEEVNNANPVAEGECGQSAE